MKDAQRPDHINLSTLITRMKEGRFVVPDFQREFEWRPWDIRDLMRSIFLDYYIGSLLLWKGKRENFEALACEPIYGAGASTRAEYIVLDGQQRLTAMHYAFVAPNVPLPNRTSRAHYFINVDRFMAEFYDEAFDYEWHTKALDSVLASREEQYGGHQFPLSVLGAGGWELANWVQGYEQFWRTKSEEAAGAGFPAEAEGCLTHARNAAQFGELLKEITEQYQISYIELDKDLAVDKVCDIFTQINSRGIRLDVFDLINALLKPKGLQLKHLWRNASKRLADVDTEKMNVYILQVMSLLRQGYCSPKYLYFLLPGQERSVRDTHGSLRKEVLVRDITQFESNWDEAVEALESAITILRHPQEYGAISSAFFPYVSILPVFAALRVQLRKLPKNQQLSARRKLSHWYWAAVFLNRYSGSVESTAARDYADVRAWLEDDEAVPAIVSEFAVRFRGIDYRKETKRGTSVYNGIFNLLVIQGARDWMTGDVPQWGSLDDHHIVPASWGKEYLKGSLGSTILNRTPLEADTNRKVIRDRLPNEYLPELIESNGEALVRGTLQSHFISTAAFDILLRDPFTPDDYEAFISERQATIQSAIESLLIKERLDLEPSLRELDARVETTELALRSAVMTALGGSRDSVPAHVMAKVTERVNRAMKKNPSMDAERYATLDGLLEFFDLRELQDAIGSKVLWTKFEARFGSKEALAIKFDQLAELRNGIRHSRTVTDIVRKEGEAALLWFSKVLGSEASGASS